MFSRRGITVAVKENNYCTFRYFMCGSKPCKQKFIYSRGKMEDYICQVQLLSTINGHIPSILSRALFIIYPCMPTYTHIQAHSNTTFLQHNVTTCCGENLYLWSYKLQLNTGTYILFLDVNKRPYNTPQEKFMC
jgi:hypothetical protein